jgi:hypothetical protein
MAVLGSFTAAGCGSSNDCDADNLNDPDCLPTGGSATVVVVKNPCTVPISEIHVAAVHTTNWGTNLISGTVFSPNASVNLAVPCGTYAVELVGPNGRTATLDDVNVCAGNVDWIGSATCAAFTTVTPKDPVADPVSSAAH